MVTEINSAAARQQFFQLLRRVGRGGETVRIKIYRQPQVRLIREDLAQLLEEIIGPAWQEIHKILARNPQLTSEQKDLIRKIIQHYLEKGTESLSSLTK